MALTNSLIRDIRAALPDLELRENEPMSAHTSFRIGGPARLFALPKSAEEAEKLLRMARGAGVEPLIIGNGTNLLVSDAGLDNIVLRVGEGMAAIERVGESMLRAGAGVPLARLSQRAQALGLSGLEFASGIPGTLGGAVSMNAGAYGGEMSQVVRRAAYVGREGPGVLNAGTIGFAYRRSAFTDTDALITAALIELTPDEPERIASRMRELNEKRRASQPLDLPSAGSTFKRPVGGYAAALIDEAGLKGYKIGGAMVSEKHAGFVVNTGGATFEDVIKLMEHIKRTVFVNSGVTLEPEVKVLR